MFALVLLVVCAGCHDGGGGGGTPHDTWWALAPATGSPPTARMLHSAAMAAGRMVVWGGYVGATSHVPTGTGGVYDPHSRTWSPTSPAGAPQALLRGVCVSLGDRVLVWGGHAGDPAQPLNDGAIYDPLLDAWTPVSTSTAPTPRWGCTAVWTGSEVLVWGGAGYAGKRVHLGDGAAYDPATDAWRPLSDVGAPCARIPGHAVWTGTHMFVWGGNGGQGSDTVLGDGALYDPATDTWTPVATQGAPAARAYHAAAWTGTHVLVWGGRTSLQHYDATDSGALYDPATDTWRHTSTIAAPCRRENYTATWTGTHLVVWGGQDDQGTALGSGASYDPAADVWTPCSPLGAPSARMCHSAVWTGRFVLIWGGWAYGNPSAFKLADGKAYVP